MPDHKLRHEVLIQKMDARGIPDYMQNSLARYIMEGTPVGGFLMALLSNDLRKTFEKADEVNQQRVYNYVMFLYNDAPGGCWGSKEIVKGWIAHQGMKFEARPSPEVQ